MVLLLLLLLQKCWNWYLNNQTTWFIYICSVITIIYLIDYQSYLWKILLIPSGCSISSSDTPWWKIYMRSSTRQVPNSHTLCVMLKLGQLKEFKRGNQVSFWPCVDAMGRQPFWRSRMEVSYCTFLIWRDHSARSVHIVAAAWFTVR